MANIVQMQLNANSTTKKDQQGAGHSAPKQHAKKKQTTVKSKGTPKGKGKGKSKNTSKVKGKGKGKGTSKVEVQSKGRSKSSPVMSLDGKPVHHNGGTIYTSDKLRKFRVKPAKNSRMETGVHWGASKALAFQKCVEILS